MRNLLLGIAAGAAGTAALNVVTYLDMTVRGRPASQVPAKIVEVTAEKAGMPLGAEDEDEDTIQNRKSGVGALLGYGTGLGIGALYGVVRPQAQSVPLPLAGVAAGAAAMLGSDLPATALGVTDPRQWSKQSWASDIVPHLAYGVVTAVVLDQFRSA